MALTVSNLISVSPGILKKIADLGSTISDALSPKDRKKFQKILEILAGYLLEVAKKNEVKAKKTAVWIILDLKKKFGWKFRGFPDTMQDAFLTLAAEKAVEFIYKGIPFSD